LTKLAKAVGVVDGGWNGFNILQTAAARAGALDIGFVSGKTGLDTKSILKAARSGDLDVLYLLGADEHDFAGISPDTFVIYQGSHGDAGARIADVVLPGAAWCEKDATFVNTEGRVQFAPRATFPPGDAREDWAIIRALSAALKKTLPFDTLESLRSEMVKSHPVLGERDVLTVSRFKGTASSARISGAPVSYVLGAGTDTSFYMTCPISRNSVTMAACIDAFEGEMKGAAE